MNCPRCKTGRGYVIDSKRVDDSKATRRRYECTVCKQRFTSYERQEVAPLPIIVTRSKRLRYENYRVRYTMECACAKLPVSSTSLDSAVARIDRKILDDPRKEIPVDELCAYMAEELGRLHEVARVRFEMEWLRPRDSADCMNILMAYMRRKMDL